MKISHIAQILLILTLSLQTSADFAPPDPIDDVCSYKRFPIVAGGSADETI